MLRIAIVDDIKEDACNIRGICHDFFDDLALNIKTDIYYDAQSFIIDFQEKNHTLIFMDIYLKEANGVEISKWVKQKNPSTLIIFLTTSDEFVWDALALHSFDYILKPYTKERIITAITDVLKLDYHQSYFIDFKIGRKIVQINAYDICYLISEGHYINIYLMDQMVKSFCSFKNAQEKLKCLTQFIQCNRGIIVNMNHIIGHNNDCFIMSDQQPIPIRCNNRSAIIEQFISFKLQQRPLSRVRL